MPVTSSKRALLYLALYTVSTAINNYLPIIGRYTLDGKSNLPATSSEGRYSFSLASGKSNEPARWRYKYLYFSGTVS